MLINQEILQKVLLWNKIFRIALFAFLIAYCSSFFSQPVYSRDFEARKKNVPLAIINNHSNYFFLLRYNKAAHDITIERRAKPSAEIVSFTPLKLDSINADWFNYENLDYLFFEYNYHTYFLFEKVLNSKKSIYLKITDTLGKASGFIELAALEKEKGVTEIDFEYKRTYNNNILIVASQTYGTFLIKKTVLIFDVEKRKVVLTKKLPIENAATGYSTAFEANATNDLFFVLAKAHIVSYKRKNINHEQVQVPVFFYDSLIVVSFLNKAAFPVRNKMFLDGFTGVNSIRLIPSKETVSTLVHFSSLKPGGEICTYFLNEKFNNDLTNTSRPYIIPLDSSIKENLTFYDGTDYKSAAYKEYRLLTNLNTATTEYVLTERVEDYYYKELLVLQNDPKTGQVLHQNIIPRKIYSFKGRTRFKNIGKAMPFIFKDKLHVVVLESPANFKKETDKFNYHRFKKETNLWHSNLVMYTIDNNGVMDKKLLYHNANFDAVPLPYQAENATDIVLYLNNTKVEKFVILRPDQL